MAFDGFHLLFPQKEIGYWSQQYPVDWDQQALLAGKKIREERNFSRSNLEIIVRWKSQRRAGLIAKNSSDEISDALDLALRVREPRSAFAVLEGLRGVATPVASAILTAIDQERFTVIDYRALEALGAPNSQPDLNFYLDHYFPECKRLASEAQVSLSTLDRALGSWSAKKGTKA